MTESGFRLRPLVAGDIDAIAGILRQGSVARWWGPYDRQRIDREMLRAGGTLAVECAGAVRGFVMVGDDADPEFRHATLDIALDEAHQGRGLGRAVLAAVVERLRAGGHHRVTIDPAAENARAIRCFAAAGFREVGRLRMYQRLGDGRWHDGLLMELTIPDAAAEAADEGAAAAGHGPAGLD